MRYLPVLLLLGASSAFAQANSAAAPSKARPVKPATRAVELVPAKSVEVSPGTIVITLEGVCATAGPKAADCKTSITRAEFERLMDVLSRRRTGEAWRSIPPQATLQLAEFYARLTILASAAERQGLQREPEAQELIRFSRLEALSEEFSRQLTKKAAITPEEVRKYYDDNPERFVEVALQRVQVPRPQAGGDLEAVRKLAGDLHERAVAGADFQTLQAEAAQAPQSPTNGKLVAMKDSLPPSVRAAVSLLKPGEVTPVIEEGEVFSIYKLEALRQAPFEAKSPEIQFLLAGQAAQREVEKLLSSTAPKLNPEYFGQVAPRTGLAVPQATRSSAGAEGK